MKILVAYDSAHGSTQSIAERIQARIQAGAVGDTTLSAITATLSVEDFDVLVIGSAIHYQGWLKQSSAFVKRSSAYLHDHPKPTWAFSVGMPPDAGVASEEKTIEKWLSKFLVLRGHKLFQGEYKEKDLNGCFKFLLMCFGIKFEDRRKWDQIEAWADAIVQELRVDQQTAAGN